jgi:hypothetical protein
MLHVILNQLALGVPDGLFNCVELLGKVEARPVSLKHLYHGTKVAFSALKALENGGMALMLHPISNPGG